MTDKAAIEQLKRDLRTYGYYKGRIREIEASLYNLSQQIRDCYKASGIGYGELMSNSNPKYSKVNELIYEEADLQGDRKGYIEEIKRLGIDEKLKVLTDIQLKVVRAIYFDGLSFKYVAAQTNYSVGSIQHYDRTSLIKMIEN